MTTTESFKNLAPVSRMEVAGALSNEPNSRDARVLRAAPYANRLISLKTAMVPPKVDGTSERVAEIVKGLADQGAIYPDQMGAIHSELLNRTYTWNSLGVQESIQALVNDVIHGQNRTLQEELSRTKEIANASLLTQFYDSLYKTVDRGQRNFEGFKKLLRLFINNVPTAEVYKSGGSFNLQINLGGSSQNINLSNAFDNLRDIWGARWDSVNNPRIGALLTPNTRALIFFVSAFYDRGHMEPGSYMDNIMRLYKDAIKADVDADGDAILELGEAGASLNKRFDEYKDTLNYLLQNQQYTPPSQPVELSEEQEALLRYLMRQLRQALKDGVAADVAVSTMAQYVDPRLFQTNRVFIDKLQKYLLMANAKNPSFYAAIVLDPEWRPPSGLFTGEFLIPDRHEFDLPDDPQYLAPSRDESYFEDPPFSARPPRQPTNADIDAEIERLREMLDANVGVQSEAGWITDHRLPNLFEGALNLGPPGAFDVPMPDAINAYDIPLPPSPVEMRSRSSSIGSLDSGPSRFESLRPSIGGNRHTGLGPGLSGTGNRVRHSRSLTRRVMDPRYSRLGRRLRFY